MAANTPKPLIAKSREAVWHQRNQDQQRANKIIESPDIRPQVSRQGTALFLKRVPKGSGSNGNSVAVAMIDSIEDTHLLVRLYNYATAQQHGDPIAVALPFQLRNHTNQMRTIRGTANGQDVTEVQKITPPYNQYDIILIENVGFSCLGIYDNDGEEIGWTDRNEAARAWAATAATVTVS
jgi:hypothetical protein